MRYFTAVLGRFAILRRHPGNPLNMASDFLTRRILLIQAQRDLFNHV